MITISQSEQRPGWTVVFFNVLLLVFFIQVNSGCSAVQRMGRIEPQYIAVQNLSGYDIHLVSFALPRQSMQNGIRYAYISPVPKGVIQSARRPTGAPKLPDSIEVRWETDRNGEFSQVVDLKRVLRQATETDREGTLFFRIRPDNGVDVLIEQMKR